MVGKRPEEVRDADVLAFIQTQRQPRRGTTVVRIEDGEAGLSARTIKRRLASVTGLFEYLVIRGVVPKNPVPHGLSTRSPNRGGRQVPLIRTPRTMPRVVDPDQADALLAALRTHRDQAMVQATASIRRLCSLLTVPPPRSGRSSRIAATRAKDSAGDRPPATLRVGGARV